MVLLHPPSLFPLPVCESTSDRNPNSGAKILTIPSIESRARETNLRRILVALTVILAFLGHSSCGIVGSGVGVLRVEHMKDPPDRTKVVMRHLPPAISQSVLMEQIDGRFAGRYDWVCFRPGKNSQKDQIHSRAYLNFNNPEDVVEFAEFFDGHIFVNEKGAQFKALVEYAPSQQVPNIWSKKDGREGTISKDPEYMEFLELISKPVEHLPSAEVQLERKEAERAGAKETPIVTPLMDFVRRKRAAKVGVQGLSSGRKVNRRGSGVSSGNSSSSKRGPQKRKGTTSTYVLRNNMKKGSAKEKPTYILMSRREEQQPQVDKSVSVASAMGKEALEDELASGAVECGKSKLMLLKGKEKEGSDPSRGVPQRQVFMPLVKRSPTSSSTHQASERITKSMLSREGRSYLSSSHPELQIHEINSKKDKRPPLPPNASLNVKDYISHNRSLDSVSDGDSNSHAAAYERSIGHGDRKSDMSFVSRSEDMKIHRGGRVSLSAVENGYHKHVGRRGLARDIKEVDGSLSVTEGKSSKRGSTGYSSHERQVWVQKS
ncbi:unnamed protein product [Musa banksii]